MSENLPINVDDELEVGSISYANEVIAIIAGMAANEVDGVASLMNTNAIADLFGRSKPVTRGVKVEVGVEEASVDLVLTVDYGKPIQKVCTEVQESVRKAIETMTGLHVVKVDVHVVGVSFERETQELQQGYAKATKEAVEAPLSRATIEQAPVSVREEPTSSVSADDDEIDVEIPDTIDDDDDIESDDDEMDEALSEDPSEESEYPTPNDEVEE